MSEVKLWEEEVVIPTYEVGEPDKNPMFLEKRVYQGSSGKVYPYPTTEKMEEFREPMTRQIIMISYITTM